MSGRAIGSRAGNSTIRRADDVAGEVFGGGVWGVAGASVALTCRASVRAISNGTERFRAPS
ncbi:hypothetical protein [Microbacterium telephonicum]|uniref:Uncharacterized protein n=1 Tax=Microbacterium telephonicum TaxID=1714841 RepID=A0A498C8V8_9MICO|nr:hypothetical protein [Microbacterium telephonicum]RLK52474.1 hypothetical protein C7474_0412 [Microbacterium telephonicum]